MDPETNHQANHQFRRLPKGERRVRFADSMGMELASIFLFDLISNYYFASIHSHKQLPPPKTISKIPPKPITAHNHTTNTTHSALSSPTNNNNNNNQNNYNNNNYYYNNNNCNYSYPNLHAPTTNYTYSTKPIIAATPALPKQSALVTPAAPSRELNSHSQQHQSNCYSNKLSSTTSAAATDANTNTYICQFTQPISLISFKERVKINKVHLETCTVNSRAGNISISCTIRVLNQSYDKSVIVRYTTDEWHTYTDSLASYKPGSCDGWSDKFTSTFSVTNQVKQFQTGQRIIFAVRYAVEADKVYWDNNGGLNYAVKKVN